MKLFGKLLLLSVITISVAVIAGCSATKELSDNDSKLGNRKEGIDAYKYSKELVATNTLTSRSSISKGSLESLSSSLAGYSPSETSINEMLSDEIMYKVIEFLNTPYLWGGTTKRGIDCSGFVQSVMYQSLGITLPRTSYEQSNVGTPVEIKDLKFGDLLFFDTMNKGRVSHVAIYLSDGYFVHSGSKTGVAVASLDSDFYSRTFLKARRVIQ